MGFLLLFEGLDLMVRIGCDSCLSFLEKMEQTRGVVALAEPKSSNWYLIWIIGFAMSE